MRKLLILATILASSLGWAGTCGNGYLFSRQIMLQKATGSNQTNFPFVLNGAWASPGFRSELRTAANGGQVQNTAANSAGVTGPADLVFCDAASAGNALKYETAYYSATTGNFEFWVQVPTLHSATNDSIWIFANNSSVSTSQQDLSLWADAGYVFVSHLADGTTLSLADSTGNSTPTITGSPTALAGEIDGGGGSWSTANYGTIPTSTALKSPTTALTVEAWAYATSCASYPWIVNVPAQTGTWAIPYVSYGLGLYNNTCQVMAWIEDSGSQYFTQTGTAVSLYRWSYLSGTYDGSNIRSYLNGTNVATVAHTGSISYPVSANGTIGQHSSYDAGEPFSGALDEIRIANVVKSADWLTTTYNLESGLASTFKVIESTSGVVQYTSCQALGTSSFTCTLPFDATSGNLLTTLSASLGEICTSMAPFSDTLSSTFSNLVHVWNSAGLSNSGSCINYAPLISSGADTVTVNVSPGVANTTMVVAEIKGAVSTPDTTGTNISSSAASISVGPTTASGSSLLLCVGGNDNGSSQTQFLSSATPSDGMVLGGDSTSGSYDIAGGFVMKFVSAGAQTCTFNFNGASVQQSAVLGFLGAGTSTSVVKHKVVSH